MKKFIMILSLLLAFTALVQAGVREDFKEDVHRSASNYYAYPDKNLPKLTPAPKGYVPFYLDHYGRHGSRWMMSRGQYEYPVKQLEKGERNGKLTERGKYALSVLRQLLNASTDRYGELTTKGAEQHRGIARRMFANFPEVFAGNARIEARSSVAIRCILSMQNETDALMSLNPKLRINTDASFADMVYINCDDPRTSALRAAGAPLVTSYRNNHVHPENYLKNLFTDSKFAADSIDGSTLMTNMFDVISNLQSHHEFENVNLYDLYSDDDIYNLWSVNNVNWYILAGETPLTNCRVDYNQVNLLHSFIASADSAIASGKNCATLRFGHESVVMPFSCLIGLNGADYHTTDLETLADHWQNYKIYPMGSNIQMIFYRKKGSDDIILKVLLNEHEATLPVKTDCAPYYHWKDVRAYFIDKIAREPE
jgi:hypothetical protein